MTGDLRRQGDLGVVELGMLMSKMNRPIGWAGLSFCAQGTDVAPFIHLANTGRSSSGFAIKECISFVSR